MPKLSKRTVEALAIGEKDYFTWDSDMRGFGVRVLPSGKRVYVIQYRHGGRTRRMVIGAHGVITAEEARREAKGYLGAVAKGEDPSGARSAHRRSPTLADACERFMQEHVAERCKPSTQAEYRRAVDLFIKPRLGAFKLVDIVRADISKLHHEMKDTPYQANRTLGVLSKIFNLCELWGLRPDGSNPCRHVKKYPERKRERFLSADELGRLGEVLNEVERDGSETPSAVAAIRLLILTGCRLGEIQTLRWESVGNAYLSLLDSKTGPRKVPLTPASKAVLASIAKLEDNPYVITGKKPGQHLTDLQHPWRRIRAKAGLPDVRIHDLRHTFASNAVASGLSLPMIGKLLGHTQVQTTARYAHLADDPLRESALRVASGIAEQLKPSEA